MRALDPIRQLGAQAAGLARRWPKPTGRCAATLLLAAFVAAPAAAQVDTLFARLEPSVWSLSTFDRKGEPLIQGSAVVIGPGRLLTTCNALARAGEVLVSRDNVSYGATLEYPDVERDLCQLKVANFKAPPVTVADAANLRVGMRVYAIGSPKGLEATLSDGLLSALRRDEQGRLQMLQTSAPVSAGSGGGGLFDAQGRLIGIMSGMRRDAQNLNFAIPASLSAELPERGARALDRWRGVTSDKPDAAPVVAPAGAARGQP